MATVKSEISSYWSFSFGFMSLCYSLDSSSLFGCVISEPRTNKARYLGRDCRAEQQEQTVDQTTEAEYFSLSKQTPHSQTDLSVSQ